MMPVEAAGLCVALILVVWGIADVYLRMRPAPQKVVHYHYYFEREPVTHPKRRALPVKSGPGAPAQGPVDYPDLLERIDRHAAAIRSLRRHDDEERTQPMAKKRRKSEWI